MEALKLLGSDANRLKVQDQTWGGVGGTELLQLPLFPIFPRAGREEGPRV